MIKEETHMFQGMKRGTHQIKQDSKFLWDAHNVRLTNREGNTLLSITNEIGTSDSLLTLENYYVGHCIVNKYLIIFTANDDSSENYIYRIEETKTGYRTIILYYDELGSWDPNNPIEAIGVYETELVQKVYWVDGINQPRVINIAKPEYKIPKEYLVDGINLSGPVYSTDTTINEYFKSNYPYGFYLKGSFDFVRELSLQESINITKIYGQGEFSPGTIQYAFSYYNKYEQESNICYITPICYISPKDRGGKADEKISNSFKIEILFPDTQFEYIRVFSIHRTSINATPVVKVVADIPAIPPKNSKGTILWDTPIQIIDTGTMGYTIDPTQLLYIGGESIVADCIAQKGNTLFLGSIAQQVNSTYSQLKDIITSDWETDDYYIESFSNTSNLSSSYYDYTPSLSSYTGRFMPDETYRCGIQAQYKNGRWSAPIFIDDLKLCSKHAWETELLSSSTAINLINSTSANIISKLKNLGVAKLRACVVFPKAEERHIICQGVLCPTVYNVGWRRNDAPYAASSWFFRPATKIDEINNTQNIYQGASIQFQHNRALYTSTDRGAEVQNMLPDKDTLDTISDADTYSSHFFVDENIVTFHSPDLEFDTSLSNYNWDGVQLNIVGLAMLGAISGDIDIQTSTPPRGEITPGFVHTTIGYQTRNNYFMNGGLVMAPLYEDSWVKKDTFEAGNSAYWPIYPWHRSGSLNNDSKRPTDKGTRSAILLKKKISNLKFFDKNLTLTKVGEESSVGSIQYNITTPQLFSSNEASLLKISPTYLKKEIPYWGNIDALITSGKSYKLFNTASLGGEFNEVNAEGIQETSESVRIKYKSSPHLVFSLFKKDSNGRIVSTEIPVLPKHTATKIKVTQESFTFPNWQQPGPSDGSSDDKNKYDYELLLYSTSNIEFSPKSSTSCRITVSNPGKTNEVRFLRIANPNDNSTWSPVPADGRSIIIKVAPGSTSIYPSTNYIPGTTKSDYNKTSYASTVKYYKITMGSGVQAGIIASMEAVTLAKAQSEQAPSEQTYTITRKIFGEDTDTARSYPYLLIGELVRNNIVNKFGGTSQEALQQNLWLPAGRPVDINLLNNSTSIIPIPFEYGDTWYGRYDCLKTYPFTQEDENSVVEIGSFLCHTRINIDSRSDRNRGQLSNLNMTPQNFNQFNEVYNQKDNFYTYRILNEDFYKQNKFKTQVTWSKEKTNGEEIDTWTNVTIANTIDMDGKNGEVTAIIPWNDGLFCFQDKALNQLMFNSRVQIPTADGVPIEISNGYKLDSTRIISSTIGCQNKWSIVSTPMGIYFIDAYTNSIYLFNGKLNNLSRTNGMDWWVKASNPDVLWKPIISEGEVGGIRTFYDASYGDIYFTPIGETTEALCYSEVLGAFVSFMSYNGSPAMFNFNNNFYSIKTNQDNLKTGLYKNNAGLPNDFYGEYKPWSISFISNDNPLNTKVFDNIELRADSYKNNILQYTGIDAFPISYIKVSNEYQNGISNSDTKNTRRKFRVWRSFIPRNDGTRQRIRNPWAMITLGWKPNNNMPDKDSKKTIIHDVTVKYTI